MLDLIKKSLTNKYDLTQAMWLFLSSFDTQWAMISSNGSIQTDKPLDQLIDLLYHGLIEKEQNVKTMVVDVVTNIAQETDMAKLQALDLKTNGLCLVGEQNKSWTILPWTQGVETVQQALQLVKEKYQLAGNATIYAFQTDRIVVE